MLLRGYVLACAVVAILGLAASTLTAQPKRSAALPATAPHSVEPAIANLLTAIRAADKGQLAVSEEDGQFLRLLVGATNAKSVLEIGGASGYSAIWIGMGLRQSGGRLVTIEYDPVRAKELAANIQKAGLSDIVRVVAGDAFAEVPKVPGNFDLVFLDAWKPDYKRFFELAFPRVNPGGLFLAHNVINKRNDMLDFLSAIEKHPLAFNTTVAPGHEGISITYKKR